ncbi:hypothetical protein [Paenibacillus sp. PCH8]
MPIWKPPITYTFILLICIDPGIAVPTRLRTNYFESFSLKVLISRGV